MLGTIVLKELNEVFCQTKFGEIDANILCMYVLFGAKIMAGNRKILVKLTLCLKRYIRECVYVSVCVCVCVCVCERERGSHSFVLGVDDGEGE